MENTKIDRNLLRSYLKIAEFSRGVEQEEYEFLALNISRSRDDLRAKFPAQFLRVADIAYERVLLGDNLENVLVHAIPKEDFGLPERIYLSKGSYFSLLSYLSVQLFYVILHREYYDSFPVENALLDDWYTSKSNYHEKELRKLFAKDGIDYDLFKHNESSEFVPLEKYEEAFRKIINVYVPESLD